MVLVGIFRRPHIFNIKMIQAPGDRQTADLGTVYYLKALLEGQTVELEMKQQITV